MIEDSPTSGEPPQTIKAQAALARMNGLAPAADLQEIHLFEAGPAGQPGEARRLSALKWRGVYLVRQKDFDEVASQGTVEQAQGALGSETAYGVANGLVRDANAAGKPNDPKTELALALEAAMPHEMGVDHALGKIEAKAGHENIFELFPDECSIGFLVIHGWGSKGELTVHCPERVGIFDWEFTARKRTKTKHPDQTGAGAEL